MYVRNDKSLLAASLPALTLKTGDVVDDSVFVSKEMHKKIAQQA